MESIASVLGWLAAITVLMAVVTTSLLLLSLVEIAGAAGGCAGQPIPAGVQRRAARVEARIRARYRPLPADLPMLASAGAMPAAPRPDAVGSAVDAPLAA